MITKRFFTKVICAFFLGLVCTAAFIKYDKRFLDLAHETMVGVFKNNYGADFCAEGCELHPLSLSITFKNVRVRPLDSHQEWRWNAKEITVRCNPLSYLYSRVIQLHITVDFVKAHTHIANQEPTIQGHITRMLQQKNGALPLEATGVILNGVDITFNHSDMNFDGALVISSLVAHKAERHFMTHITCVEGLLTTNHRPQIQSLYGALDIDFDETTGITTYALDGSCKNCQLPDKDAYVFFFKGGWDGQQGSCTLHTKDRSLELYPCTITKKEDEYLFSVQCFSYAEIIKRIVAPDIKDVVEGTCVGTIHGSSKGGVKGVGKFNGITYQGYGFDDLLVSFTERSGVLQGDVRAAWNKNVVEGRIAWSCNAKKGSLKLINTSSIPLHGYWQLMPRTTTISGEFSRTASNLSYTTVARHTKTDETLTSTGSLEHRENEIIAQGLVGAHTYKLEAGLVPFILKNAVYLDQAGQELCKCVFTDPNHFTAFMDYATVRAFALSWYDFFLPGQGICTLDGSITNTGLTAHLDLSNALIRMSGTYNFIARATMELQYDALRGLIKIHDAQIGLHKGSIESKRITLRLPGHTTAFFIHMPIHFHNCFVNVRKYLYGSFSGSLLYVYDGKQPMLSGFCNLGDVHIAGNIFASDLYGGIRDFFAHEVPTKNTSTALSLHVTSHQPITVNTSVMDTSAQVVCSIKNTLDDPSFEGTLRLKGGRIKFPAHSLTITRGTVTLVPYQQHEHLLDIVAQGRIKKYLITLIISGSIQDPTVVLQASPGLTQEQIVMLLFSGTEEESLNVMAPALVMFNAQKFLFAADQQSSQGSLIPGWMRPFQRVSFLPRFTDQTGRGGLKGVLEVEFNDRLSASIEKNFSLSENAAVQLEYLLSDDVSVKLNKGDRSDLGAEVEMRFKF